MRTRTMAASAAALLLVAPLLPAQTPLGTAFTYQGQLTSTGTPVNGPFDFQFILYTAAVGGSQVGPIVNLNGVMVTDGRFTVSLDFEAGAFPGDARWLDIALRPAGGPTFTILTPRQPLAAAPYALTAAQVVDAAIVNADISAVANISGTKLADNSVPAAKIVDGAGSGLDADLLDNLNSTQFLRSDTSGTLLGTLTVNSGAGTNALLSETGIDRASALPETFVIQNSGVGSLQLQVEGGGGLSAPAYSFATDTNTGLTSPGPNALALIVAGNSIVTVDTGGLDAVAGAVGGVAVTGTATGSGDGVFGSSGNGRGVVARNIAAGPALVASSFGGDHLRASTSINAADTLPVLRVTNAGAVLAEGTLRAGAAIDTATVANAWHSFGTGTKDEVTIDNQNDVYVSADLEIDGNAYVGSVVAAGAAVQVATATILDTNSLDVGAGFTINVGGNPASLLINGLNANVQIGNGSSDALGIGRAPAVNNLEVAGTASKTTAGDWLANSDRRLKTDIEGLTDALGVVRRLRPVRFRYSDEFRRKNPSVKDVYYHNYVAQEFQQVFADSVQDDGEGFLQMDAHPAGVYAVGAIQELDRLLAEKEAKITALERRLAVLEQALAQRTETTDATASR